MSSLSILLDICFRWIRKGAQLLGRHWNTRGFCTHTKPKLPELLLEWPFLWVLHIHQAISYEPNGLYGDKAKYVSNFNFGFMYSNTTDHHFIFIHNFLCTELFPQFFPLYFAGVVIHKPFDLSDKKDTIKSFNWLIGILYASNYLMLCCIINSIFHFNSFICIGFNTCSNNCLCSSPVH